MKERPDCVRYKASLSLGYETVESVEDFCDQDSNILSMTNSREVSIRRMGKNLMTSCNIWMIPLPVPCAIVAMLMLRCMVFKSSLLQVDV